MTQPRAFFTERSQWVLLEGRAAVPSARTETGLCSSVLDVPWALAWGALAPWPRPSSLALCSRHSAFSQSFEPAMLFPPGFPGLSPPDIASTVTPLGPGRPSLTLTSTSKGPCSTPSGLFFGLTVPSPTSDTL